MISKELSEAAVELNVILDNSSEEVIKKIPKKFIRFMKENASNTYKFEYDKNKPLEEQTLKPKTKGLIALIYKDYLCDTTEKEEYLNSMAKILNDIEMEKREQYNPDNIFINKKQEKVNLEGKILENDLPIKIQKRNIFTKIILFIKNIFNKR